MAAPLPPETGTSRQLRPEISNAKRRPGAEAGSARTSTSKRQKKPGTNAGLSLFVVLLFQLARVRVTFTVWPQNVPVTVTVCVAGSNEDVMSTSHVPEPPVRAHVKLPLWVCV